MNIIFGRENADILKDRYLVLDLETLILTNTETNQTSEIETYCVVPTEAIPLGDIHLIDSWAKLHQDFVNGYKKQEFDYCLQCLEHLKGKFQCYLDSYYSAMEERILIEKQIN
jgi:hypothetical protein